MILRRAVMASWLKKRIKNQLDYFSKNKREILLQINHSNFLGCRELWLENYRDRVTNLQKQELNNFPSLPFVIINSRVSLYHPLYNDTLKITICFPEEEVTELGWYSFLSSVGRQLLLKKVGETVYVEENIDIDGRIIEAIEYSSSN